MPFDAAVGDERHSVARRPPRQSTSACSCGTPKLVVMRVVQPPPGPIPTFTALAPRSARNRAPSAVATLPAIDLRIGEPCADAGEGPFHDHGMPVGDVDDQHVCTGAQELGRAFEIVASSADRRADAQAALIVTRGKREPPLPEQIAAP